MPGSLSFGQSRFDDRRTSRAFEKHMPQRRYSFSKLPSCFESVTGALQVKFPQTYAAKLSQGKDV